MSIWNVSRAFEDVPFLAHRVPLLLGETLHDSGTNQLGTLLTICILSGRRWCGVLESMEHQLLNDNGGIIVSSGEVTPGDGTFDVWNIVNSI